VKRFGKVQKRQPAEEKERKNAQKRYVKTLPGNFKNDPFIGQD
jgi:hypothetical protein